MNPTALSACQSFTTLFGGQPQWLVRAPGRVNLIGEHTDYNDGFVLPMAIDRAVWIALRPRLDRRVRVHSLDFDQTQEFAIDLPLVPGKDWVDYVKGVTWALGQAGRSLVGWEGVLVGDLPIAAGLSSSAAVEMVVARVFATLGQWDWQPILMAEAGHRAESEWVGVRGGMMDQVVCAAARQGHTLFMDCRSLEIEHIPMPPGLLVAVLDTGTRRNLADSEYNQRSAQCREAARRLGVPALRDADESLLEKHRLDMDETLFKRARHVIRENGRVLDSVKALRQGSLEQLGSLLDASHESLRLDFQVSSPALDEMVTIARQAPGCLGARLTGAGFAGCAMALVRQAAAGDFEQAVLAGYAGQGTFPVAVYLCRPQSGASLEPLPRAELK